MTFSDTCEQLFINEILNLDLVEEVTSTFADITLQFFVACIIILEHVN